jgi:hypothetical protein
MKKEIKDFFEKNKEKITHFHENKELNFVYLMDGKPSGEFYKFYKSQNFKRCGTTNLQSSEYRIGKINGKFAYLRTSNHWGFFTTREEDYYIIHTWNLEGAPLTKKGEFRHVSQTGYVYLDGAD